MAARTIILHYHLFKNAGTSVDRILKDNFADGWQGREFAGNNNTTQVVDWIRNNPSTVAFSSHTMMGPLPKIDGVRIVSVMFLRDPIDRIRSAYRFEHKQKSGNFGAVLAKATDFDGYVRVRLSLPNDRQCRNFQTWRLANLVPGTIPEIDRAKAALRRLDVVGLVEDFDTSMAALKAAIADAYPDFEFTPVHANASRLEESCTASAVDIARLLEESNRDDSQILAVARRLSRDRAAALQRRRAKRHLSKR